MRCTLPFRKRSIHWLQFVSGLENPQGRYNNICIREFDDLYKIRLRVILVKRVDEKFYDAPMILSGGFNIDFADGKNVPLVQFSNRVLGWVVSNDRELDTIKYRTAIDAVFTRYSHKYSDQTFLFLSSVTVSLYRIFFWIWRNDWQYEQSEYFSTVNAYKCYV